jgi:hypothetical protein
MMKELIAAVPGARAGFVQWRSLLGLYTNWQNPARTANALLRVALSLHLLTVLCTHQKFFVQPQQLAQGIPPTPVSSVRALRNKQYTCNYRKSNLPHAFHSSTFEVHQFAFAISPILHDFRWSNQVDGRIDDLESCSLSKRVSQLVLPLLKGNCKLRRWHLIAERSFPS